MGQLISNICVLKRKYCSVKHSNFLSIMRTYFVWLVTAEHLLSFVIYLFLLLQQISIYSVAVKVTVLSTYIVLNADFKRRHKLPENIENMQLSLCLCIFLKVEISLCTLIPLFRPGQSTVAQWAETTVAKCSLTSCVWAHFLIGSHTMPTQRHSQPSLILKKPDHKSPEKILSQVFVLYLSTGPVMPLCLGFPLLKIIV